MDPLKVNAPPISSKQFIGKRVQNPQGEDLGEISEIHVDLENGFVTNLILVTGGMGFKKPIAISWNMLDFSDGGAILDLDRDFIRQVPAYDADGNHS